jgi:hypothetical protein
MRLDLFSINDVPHIESLREYEDWTWDPIVIDQEVTVWETVDLQSKA